jgi:hypothetical protein
MNQLQTCEEQRSAVNAFFAELLERDTRLQYTEELAA